MLAWWRQIARELSPMAWAVAVTKPNYEFRVEGYLARQGFAVYAPKIREQIVASGKVYFRQAPLFRSYIFVAAVQAWQAVERTFGVIGLLRSTDKQAAIVSPDVIKDLRMRQNKDGYIQLPKFSAGETVRITAGPFAGQLALYQGMTSRQREWVLLSALGCRLELSVGNLEAV